MNNKMIALFLITLAVLPAVALAVPKAVSTYEGNPKPNGQAGKSSVNQLYLVEKNPSNWKIVEDGAWGKLTIKNKGKFVFNGHELTSNTGYTLIYYGDNTQNDVWPYATCMASGTTDSNGNIHLTGTMPSMSGTGKIHKIWLVLSKDVDCTAKQMTAWNPTEYLFEYALI